MGIEQLENYLIVIIVGILAILVAISLLGWQLEGIKRRVRRLQESQSSGEKLPHTSQNQQPEPLSHNR